MTIDDAIQILSYYQKLFNNLNGNYRLSQVQASELSHSIDTILEIIREYQKIFIKFEILTSSFEDSDSPEIRSNKVDEFCIDTMRGILGSYYTERILEDVDDN